MKTPPASLTLELLMFHFMSHRYYVFVCMLNIQCFNCVLFFYCFYQMEGLFPMVTRKFLRTTILQSNNFSIMFNARQYNGQSKSLEPNSKGMESWRQFVVFHKFKHSVPWYHCSIIHVYGILEKLFLTLPVLGQI